jgi:hypothetical protein
LVPVALIIEQPDLGTGMLVLASGMVVLFMAGIGWGYIVAALRGLSQRWCRSCGFLSCTHTRKNAC